MQYFAYQTFRSVILPYYASIDRAPFDADIEPGLNSELLINGKLGVGRHSLKEA